MSWTYGRALLLVWAGWTCDPIILTTHPNLGIPTQQPIWNVCSLLHHHHAQSVAALTDWLTRFVFQTLPSSISIMVPSRQLSPPPPPPYCSTICSCHRYFSLLGWLAGWQHWLPFPWQPGKVYTSNKANLELRPLCRGLEIHASLAGRWWWWWWEGNSLSLAVHTGCVW